MRQTAGKPHSPDIRAMHEKIQAARIIIEELKTMGSHMPFMVRNSERALASVKMMELNLSDLVMLDE